MCFCFCPLLDISEQWQQLQTEDYEGYIMSKDVAAGRQSEVDDNLQRAGDAISGYWQRSFQGLPQSGRFSSHQSASLALSRVVCSAAHP